MAKRLFRDDDTIFALATGARKAAVAVFRVSGPLCRSTLAILTRSAKANIPRNATLRTIYDPIGGHPIDRALVTLFEAPSSFTGEDVLEIGVTGGRAVITSVSKALASIPRLRGAEAGEFAWRAFLGGKLDLSSVEGLADLV